MKLARSYLGAGSARWLLALLTLRCRATVSANPAGFFPPGDHHLLQQSRYDSGRAPNGIRTVPSNNTATQIDTLFHKVIYADNSIAAHYLQSDVSDGTTTQTRHAWLPQATTGLDYDDDGNLTGDGQWTYTRDAEPERSGDGHARSRVPAGRRSRQNRLVGMDTTIAAVTAGRPFRKLAFHYDWTGRRLARTVTDTNNTVLSATRWLYDAWNPVAEYSIQNSTLSIQNSYLWGMDMSGTMQGAGGVGGLLAVDLLSSVSGSSVFLPSFDGNGNITAWTQSGATAPVCRREYDAFGNIVAEQGTPPCSLGFSTKIEDPETGLLYYGHRYLSPPLGRWLSPDPIEEEGGVNLYGFVGNSGVTGWDFLGLLTLDEAIEGGISWKELKELEITEDQAIAILKDLAPDNISTDEEVTRSIAEDVWVIRNWGFVKERRIRRLGCDWYNICKEKGLTTDQCIEYVRESRNRLRAKLILFRLGGSEDDKMRLRIMAALAELALISSSALPGVRPPVAPAISNLPKSPMPARIDIRRGIPNKLNLPKQQIHVPGPKHVPGRSVLKEPAEQLLAEIHSGTARIVRINPRGQPVVDFGRTIGTSNGLPTRYGTIHIGKNGAHIVPANPIQN